MKKTSQKTKAGKTEQNPVPKIVLPFKCKKDHTVDMTIEALRITIATRDADDKVTGIFRTNQLCPICLVDALNNLAETFPVVPPAAATSEET